MESQPTLNVFSPTAGSPVTHHFVPDPVILYVGNWFVVSGTANTSRDAPLVSKQADAAAVDVKVPFPLLASIVAWSVAASTVPESVFS